MTEVYVVTADWWGLADIAVFATKESAMVAADRNLPRSKVTDPYPVPSEWTWHDSHGVWAERNVVGFGQQRIVEETVRTS